MDEPSCLNVVSRPFHPNQDQAFVYATWRNSLYYGSDLKRDKNPRSIFKDLTHQIKEKLKTATVKIACLEDSPGIIIGYVVYTGEHLEWVYVKDSFRKQGVASLMVPKFIKTFTNQRTKVGSAILDQKNKGE